MRRENRIRWMVWSGWYEFAAGRLAQLTWQRWAYHWNQSQKVQYVRGLVHGLAWWMLWEREAAHDEGRTNDEEAWDRVRLAIAEDDVVNEIYGELEKYCETVIKGSGDGLFLKAVPKTIWNVAKQHGAPLPELAKG